jgi:alpha-tubulin suppressor-like RCC1 family protein
MTTDSAVYLFGELGICGGDLLLDESVDFHSSYNSQQPKRIRALDGKGVTSVSCGLYHAAAVTATGTIFTWGEDFCGQLGRGTYCAVAASDCSTSTDDPDDGHVRAVGVLTLLKACSRRPHQPRPMLPKGGTESATCGGAHTVAITAGGLVYSFGADCAGQLGLGLRRPGGGNAGPGSSAGGKGEELAAAMFGAEHRWALPWPVRMPGESIYVRQVDP